VVDSEKLFVSVLLSFLGETIAQIADGVAFTCLHSVLLPVGGTRTLCSIENSVDANVECTEVWAHTTAETKSDAPIRGEANDFGPEFHARISEREKRENVSVAFVEQHG
jgi:hypothetical protein